MTVSAKLSGDVKAALSFDKQIRFAAALTLTRLAQATRDDITRQMREKIQGGPTPYTLRAMDWKKATRDNLTARVFLRTDFPSKGNAWSKTLAHLFTGGSRNWKKMEGAFLKAGILLPGYRMVAAANSWAAPLDVYGNLKPSLITRLIAYFGAFGESGYRANMTAKSKARLAKKRRGDSGYLQIQGVQYFVSRGRGTWQGAGSWRNGRTQNLPAGIWAKRGTHGADVAPVFLFVKGAQYRRMFDLRGTAEKVIEKNASSEFQSALRNSLRTAK